MRLLYSPQVREDLETLEAMAEALRISRDPNVKGYRSMEELKKTLDD